MISKSSGNPVDGGFENGPEGKAQCFVGGVLHAAGRPHGFTGGVRQFEVSIHCLETKTNKCCSPSLCNYVHNSNLKPKSILLISTYLYSIFYHSCVHTIFPLHIMYRLSFYMSMQTPASTSVTCSSSLCLEVQGSNLTTLMT